MSRLNVIKKETKRNRKIRRNKQCRDVIDNSYICCSCKEDWSDIFEYCIYCGYPDCVKSKNYYTDQNPLMDGPFVYSSEHDAFVTEEYYKLIRG